MQSFAVLHTCCRLSRNLFHQQVRHSKVKEMSIKQSVHTVCVLIVVTVAEVLPCVCWGSMCVNVSHFMEVNQAEEGLFLIWNDDRHLQSDMCVVLNQNICSVRICADGFFFQGINVVQLHVCMHSFEK